MIRTVPHHDGFCSWPCGFTQVHDKCLAGDDGLHGWVERSEVIGLKKGHHRIRVEWCDTTGALGLDGRGSSPGWTHDPIPAEALFQ